MQWHSSAGDLCVKKVCMLTASLNIIVLLQPQN